MQGVYNFDQKGKPAGAKVSNSYSIHFDSLTKELNLFETLKEERAITLHYGEVEKLDSKW